MVLASFCLSCGPEVPGLATERDGGPFDGAQCPEAGTETCNGNCVSLTRDPNNCGMCGNICDLNEDCVGARCISDRPLEFLLDWSEDGDVDLHVVRPDGHEIWWTDLEAPIAANGLDGVLDRDDQDFRGPERVSFSTPVPGDYLVCVNNYEGIDPMASYRLRIRENDEVQRMETGPVGPRDRGFRCTEATALLVYTYER